MKRFSLAFGFDDLLGVWRVFVAVLACQIAGGAAGLAYGYHYSWFVNLWIGGIAATLPGLAIGTLWQRSRAAAAPESQPLLAFLWCCGLAVCIAGLFYELPRMQREMRNLAEVVRLPEAGIRQIEVFDEQGRTSLLTLSDPAVVADFAARIADAAGFAPGKMQRTQTWYAVTTGDGRHEFQIYLDSRYPESVFGYFVRMSDTGMSSHGSFQSRALRAWVEAHLM